jgi:exosome complex component RRP4
VRPLHSRYQPEVGDVVVGRINSVADKRWGVDINSRQNAALMLSSVNLPGGVQRRRTYEDSLQMRTFFAENDLISAEVQQVKTEGAAALHTRSLKYGKLRYGIFVTVPAGLVKRAKQHFHTLRCDVDVILGNNGYIWVTATTAADKKANAELNSSEAASHSTPITLTAADRERICRVRNCIVALGRAFISISVATIMDVHDRSLQLGLEAKQILDPKLLQQVTQVAAARIS